MQEPLFREGGPHQIRRVGNDQHEFSITIPTDADGMAGRECPSSSCTPAYFKVKLGTGITAGQTVAYCPYCRHSGEPSDYTTSEQKRFAKDIVMREAEEGISRMINDALGLGATGRKKIGGGFLSVQITHKPSPPRRVRRPSEDGLRRDVVCPHCGLHHAVFGLATWCSDCGSDIFITHIEAEFGVVRSMLSDIERRREMLGVRVAARDLENALEDTVSIFEAVLRTLARRWLVASGKSTKDIERVFSKRIGNRFQNVEKSDALCAEIMGQSLFGGVEPNEIDRLRSTFEKRHLITHNLGIVDRKYLEKVRTIEREGREVWVNTSEIEHAINLSIQLFRSLHQRLFGAQPTISKS
jgi:hypothetical protein